MLCLIAPTLSAALQWLFISGHPKLVIEGHGTITVPAVVTLLESGSTVFGCCHSRFFAVFFGDLDDSAGLLLEDDVLLHCSGTLVVDCHLLGVAFLNRVRLQHQQQPAQKQQHWLGVQQGLDGMLR